MITKPVSILSYYVAAAIFDRLQAELLAGVLQEYGPETLVQIMVDVAAVLADGDED